MQKHESTPSVTPTLFAAPHRPMFFAGAVLLLASFALWILELLARTGVIGPLGWLLPAGWVHGLLMASGVLPFFMYGFLLTAMPRWQGQGDLTRGRWLPAWYLLASGWALVLVGAFIPGVIVVALLLVALGWAWLLRVFWQVAYAEVADGLHARITAWGMVGGLVAVLLWLLAVSTGRLHLAHSALQVAVWWSLLPVFLAVSHRMVPFFSSSVSPGYTITRPRWALWALVGASVGHGLLLVSGFERWLWVVDFPGAAVALWLSAVWLRGARMAVRLLAMLHIGFAWLGVGLALSALQSIAALSGVSLGAYAPLHVILVGYFGGMLFAMVSRVTLGHSGRPLQADGSTWALFLGLQAVVLLRALADLVPGTLGAGVMLVAAVLWLGTFGAWALRYLPIYWRPRVDGKPG
ncbi:MAG TPA: NnrS family protein [Azoarcus taiwanensis]|nr:NnrS family protein [Azoarcus taiwanensis]